MKISFSEVFDDLYEDDETLWDYIGELVQKEDDKLLELINKELAENKLGPISIGYGEFVNRAAEGKIAAIEEERYESQKDERLINDS